jgi:hypothetical protein
LSHPGPAPSDPPDQWRRHALTDAAFAALGAGRPSRKTIAELRRAQLSKHLLLLREIVRATPKTKTWYAHLTATQHTDPSATSAVLADPLFGAWAAHCLKSLRAGHSPAAAGVNHLATVAADARSRAHPDPAPRLAALGSGTRVLRAGHDGLAIEVRLEDVDPARELLGVTPTARLGDAEAAHWQACLADAWRLLVTRHRADAEVLADVLEVIVPVEPDPAARGISATSADAFGAVAMSAPEDGTALAVGLLHETQHSILNAIHYLFDLHTEPDALGYSPWRDDPRPASGILHGAYAYLAVTRFWRAEAQADPADRLAAFEFARWRAAVTATADALLADNPTPAPIGGGLTAAGVRLVSALRDEVRPWLDEQVDAEVARLAAAANTDHHLRWRLRNLAVDPDAAAAVAAAWRQGYPPPPEPTEVRLLPAPRRALEASTRLNLTHRRLRTSTPNDQGSPRSVDGGDIDDGGEGRVMGGAAGGRATAGDVAYSRGDYGTALSAYRKGVVEEPADDAAWAGLALVSDEQALVESVEVVAAVYRAAGTADDPLALAKWISLR